MSLESLQENFINALYGADDSTSVEMIKTSSTLSAQQQFDIYKGSVLGTLIEALGDIYPRVKAALGEQFFDAMTRRYIKTHPSYSASLDDYGAGFPLFCKGFEPLKEYAYIADLARVDLAWHRAFHAPDVKPLSAEDLESVLSSAEASERGRAVVLHPSASLLNSQFPLFQLWDMNNTTLNGGKYDEVSLDSGSESVLVWRPELTVNVRVLSEVESMFLAACQQAVSLEAVFEQCIAQLGASLSDPNILSECLAKFLSIGALSFEKAPVYHSTAK